MSHSWLNRANALGTFAGTVLAVVCIAVTATDFVHRGSGVVACEFVGTEGLQKEFGHDRAYVVLNLTADLRSEFTWNTKQLFVFINVLFNTRKNVRNEMVMWSSIIERKDQALIRLPALRPQYPYAITDQGFGLRGRQFNVTVAWNVMPTVGALYTRQHTFSGFILPDEYHTPALGKVWRPGSGMQDIGHANQEEWEAERYMEDLDAAQ